MPTHALNSTSKRKVFGFGFAWIGKGFVRGMVKDVVLPRGNFQIVF